MSNYLLEMKNICKQFDGNYALINASFNLKHGEVHVLLGENGAGKSTMVNILSGVLSKDSGEIYKNSIPVTINNPKDALDLGIGALFENYSLFYHMDVAQNIFINQEPTKKIGSCRRIDWNKLYHESEKTLKTMGLDIDPKKQVSALTVGEQKFIELARAIVSNSKVIIMDDPGTCLSDSEIDLLHKIVKRLKKDNVSFIYITHTVNDCIKLADRITVFRDGQNITTLINNEISPKLLPELMLGDFTRDRCPKLNVKIGNDYFIVKNLNTPSLNNISFSVKKGEILGITGLKGCGKLSLAKALFGYDKIISGKIYIKGKKIKINNTETAVKHGICYVPQNRLTEGLIGNSTVANNLVLSDLEKIKENFFISEQSKDKKVSKYIKMLGIKTSSNMEYAKHLSCGNQKKLMLAKWFFKGSKILILNEPTNGVDTSSKVDIYNILNDLVLSGVCVILITSHISDLIGMCDRVLVMHNREIADELYNKEIKENPKDFMFNAINHIEQEG